MTVENTTETVPEGRQPRLTSHLRTHTHRCMGTCTPPKKTTEGSDQQMERAVLRVCSTKDTVRFLLGFLLTLNLLLRGILNKPFLITMDTCYASFH